MNGGNKRKQYGFTLLELLITMGIIVVLAATALASYYNYAKATELDLAYRNILFDLRNAREKALDGNAFVNWGIHFVGTTNDYEFFSSPTNFSDPGVNIISTTYLNSTVTFTSPGSGSTTDVIFNNISGTTSAATITIASQGNSKTININALGAVY